MRMDGTSDIQIATFSVKPRAANYGPLPFIAVMPVVNSFFFLSSFFCFVFVSLAKEN